MTEGIRIDKWLWAVRIFKTRSQATEQCKRGRVMIDGEAVKPSRHIRLGDRIEVRKGPVLHRYEVTGLIQKRVSAKIATEHVTDHTPQEELDRVHHIQESAFYRRERGSGRPTKKERRLLDKLGY